MSRVRWSLFLHAVIDPPVVQSASPGTGSWTVPPVSPWYCAGSPGVSSPPVLLSLNIACGPSPCLVMQDNDLSTWLPSPEPGMLVEQVVQTDILVIQR